MKSVLISIQPYWVFLIIAKTMGWNIPKEKTVEARKTYPIDENWNKVAKIYCSKDKRSFSEIPKEYQPLMERFLGKVIGEFVCDQLYWVLSHPSVFAGHPMFFQKTIDDACLTKEEIEKYSGGKDVIGWHISDLKVYDEPKKLRDFFTIDRHAIKQCEYRERACNNPDLTNGAFLPGSYVCMKDEIDWCTACKRKPIIRPPQSWCYAVTPTASRGELQREHGKITNAAP